jgi:hypothetical protein
MGPSGGRTLGGGNLRGRNPREVMAEVGALIAIKA